MDINIVSLNIYIKIKKNNTNRLVYGTIINNIDNNKKIET